MLVLYQFHSNRFARWFGKQEPHQTCLLLLPAIKTRLYSMSRDYVLPDYCDKRVPEWVFRRLLNKPKAINLINNGLGGYETLRGGEDLVQEIIGGGGKDG